MTKKEMQAKIDKKEARKKEIKEEIKKATTIQELRSLQDEIETVNGDIADYRSIMEGMPEDSAPEGAPVAPGDEAQRSKEVHAAEQRRAGAPKLDPIAAISIGTGAQNTEARQLDAILKMPYGTPEERTEMMNEIHATPEYRSAFLKHLLGRSMNDAEKRAYDSTTTAVIPTQTSDILFQKMVKVAPLLNEITLLRVAGNVKFAVEGTRDAAAQHTENATITPAGDTLVSVSLGGYDFTKLVVISKSIQTMAIGAFEGWLTDMLSQDIAVKIEDASINGTGSSQPTGVEHSNTWAAANSIAYTKGGAPAYDDVVDQIALLAARYTGNAKFLCNNKFLYGKLAKIKDDNKQPILIRDMTNPMAMRILGFPILTSDKVTDGVMYFGDFKQMVGNLSQDVTVEANAAAGFDSRSIHYLGSAIFDCAPALADAFTKLYESAT